MNISQTYDHLGQRLEIRIVIDAYDLKASTPEDFRAQFRRQLRAEVSEVISEMIKEAQKESEPPT